MTIRSLRFRNEGALVVLQVLQENDQDHFSHRSAQWRDAATTDLLDAAVFFRDPQRSPGIGPEEYMRMIADVRREDV